MTYRSMSRLLLIFLIASLVSVGGVAAQAAPTVTADTYTVNAHGTLTVNAASGVLANDTGFNVATHRLEAYDPLSQYGAPITLASDGSFVYDAPVGFVGRDTFNYTVRNAFGANSTVVTIDVSGNVVWFIDDSAPAGGDGTFGSPFDSFAPVSGASGAGDIDAAGHTLFVYEGTYTVEFDLEPSQRLIGHSAGLDLVGTQNDVAAGATPVLNGANSFAAIEMFGVLGEVRHFTLNNTNGPAIIGGAGVGGFTLSDLTINSSGAASGGIGFSGTSGVQTLTNISLNGAVATTSPALQINGMSGAMTLTNVDVGFTGGALLAVGSSSGTITFDSTSSLSSANTVGISITSQASGASITLPLVNLAGATASTTLVSLLNNNANSTITFAGGVVASATGTSSIAFSAIGGGRLTISGTTNTLSATDGAALVMSDMELMANATFASLFSNSSGSQGISINEPVGGNDIVVTGTTSISDSASTYIAVIDTASPSGFALNLTTLNAGGARNGIIVRDATIGVSNNTSAMTTTNGIVIGCENGTVNAAFATLTAAGSSNGLRFTNCSGTVTASGGTLTSVAGANNDVVLINNSTINLTYNGSITKNTAGRAINIDGLTNPGLATFNGTVTASNASDGVRVENSARNVTFTTLNLGTAAARFSTTPLVLEGNTGRVNLGNVQIYTNGVTALDITYANASPGLVSNSASSLLDVNGNAVALNISHATSHEVSLEFASIASTGGGTHAVSLNRTAGVVIVNGLTNIGAKTTAGIEIANSTVYATFGEVDMTGVTGDGVRLTNNGVGSEFVIFGDGNFINSHTDGLGGTWTNIGGNAFNIDGARDIRVTDLTINNVDGSAVLGRGIVNLEFSNVDMTDIGDANNEHVFNLRQGETSGAPISGDFEVDNSVIENFADNGLYLENFAGALNVRWTNVTLRNNITKLVCGGDNCNGDGLLIRANGTSRINAFIQNAVFEDIDGIGITANPQGNSGARMDINVSSSAFTAETYGWPGNTNNGEVAISLRNAQGNGTLNFRLFSNDISNYTGEFALGVVEFEGGDFTTTNGVVSDLYIYHAHIGDAVSILSDGANTAGSGTTNYDLILSFDNVRTSLTTPTSLSSFYFAGNGAISGSDANAQITLTNSQFTAPPASTFWSTVEFNLNSPSTNFNRACFNITGNQIATGSNGQPSIGLFYTGSTQVFLQGMTGSGDANATARLNATNTLGNPPAVGTLNSITGATCTTPTLPVAFPFN